MAEILSLGPVRHLRSDPTSHLIYFRDARRKRSGRGLSFWFLPLKASIAEVPLDDRELPIVFHGRSGDFQDVTAQGVLTFRVTAPEIVADRIDFTVDLRTGAHLRQPLEKLALLMSQLAQQYAWTWIGGASSSATGSRKTASSSAGACGSASRPPRRGSGWFADSAR